MADKITAAELKVVQAAFSELQIAQAKLQGVLAGVAAGYDLPDGTQIDPATGAIIRPEAEALTPTPLPQGEGQTGELVEQAKAE